MTCLNCGAAMTRLEISAQAGRLAYETCEGCGSLWLDRGEMDKMAFQVQGSIELSSEEPDPAPEARALKCPRCDNADLYRVRFLDCTDILLHRCRSCGGFWLDGGELDLMNRELTADGPVSGHGFSDFVNHTHGAYWRKRVLPASEAAEPRLEAMPISGATKTGESDDPCPACGHMLATYELSGMKFEGCPACKGVWLFKDELRELKNTLEEGRLRWLDEEIEHLETARAIASKRQCPRCRTVRLVSTLFGQSGVLIDWCPQCHGQWLERNELETIKYYLKQEADRLSPAAIEREARGEAKRAVTGGPEGRREEWRDAKSAVRALVNATIFEHPGLMKICADVPRL